MSPPLVSIIIPCYNSAPWLAQAVESALAQTWAHKEVILIDDGSTDDSLKIARAFESRGLRIVSQQNAGAAAARNAGLRLARGDFIQYLDADDLLAPDKIARQLVHPCATDPAVLLSGAWGRFTDDPAEARFCEESLFADFPPVDFMVTKFTTHGMIQPAAWLVSRQLAEKAGPWDERLTLDDDGEYFTRVVLASTAVRHVSDSLAYYRSGLHGSLSRGRSDRAWTSHFLSVELSTHHLLALENSERARQASADALQRLIFESYPAVRDLRRLTSARIAELGGSRVRFDAGPRFQLASKLIGWRLAKRLRNRLSC